MRAENLSGAMSVEQRARRKQFYSIRAMSCRWRLLWTGKKLRLVIADAIPQPKQVFSNRSLTRNLLCRTCRDNSKRVNAIDQFGVTKGKPNPTDKSRSAGTGMVFWQTTLLRGDARMRNKFRWTNAYRYALCKWIKCRCYGNHDAGKGAERLIFRNTEKSSSSLTNNHE